MFESFSYSNVLIQYKRLFMSIQKRQISKHFKTINGSFSVLSHSIFVKTYILLETPFHPE